MLLHTELKSIQILTTMGYHRPPCSLIGLLAFLSGKLLRFERPVLMAIIITAAFGNTGNYGLPLVSFAFGQDALAFATLNFVTNSILFNTAGVLIASLGHMDIKTAMAGTVQGPDRLCSDPRSTAQPLSFNTSAALSQGRSTWPPTPAYPL